MGINAPYNGSQLEEINPSLEQLKKPIGVMLKLNGCHGAGFVT